MPSTEASTVVSHPLWPRTGRSHHHRLQVIESSSHPERAPYLAGLVCSALQEARTVSHIQCFCMALWIGHGHVLQTPRTRAGLPGNESLDRHTQCQDGRAHGLPKMPWDLWKTRQTATAKQGATRRIRSRVPCQARLQVLHPSIPGRHGSRSPETSGGPGWERNSSITSGMWPYK